MAAYTTIDDPEAHFQCKIYAGTGSTLSPTLDGDTDMQPDIVWIKAHNYTSDHRLFDAVRGATKMIKPSETEVEGTESTALTAFNSDGFTVGTSGDVNNSSYDYIAWCWKANGSGSSNGNGSISSTVSANTTAGISIVKWGATGSNATIGHGLGVAPTFLISKNLETVTNWYVYHGLGMGPTKYMKPNLNVAEFADSAGWQDTAPTSSVFSVGTNSSINNSGDDTITYCFAEKQGFSKFGSYTGNGNADGPMLFTGMKPALVVVKRSNSTGSWNVFDNKREGFNADNSNLYWNTNSAEQTDSDRTNPIDFLSNGFKMRGTDTDVNGSGSTYIYMAFAESPFVNSNGVPNNAR